MCPQVVDLRTANEVDLEGPGPLVGRIDIRHRSLYPERGARTDVAVEDIMIGNAPIVDVYLGYLNHRPDSFVGALEDIAAGSGATLVHCAAGKDRTGMVCALALETVGVSREAIVADYVATAERISLIMARLRASSTYARRSGRRARCVARAAGGDVGSGLRGAGLALRRAFGMAGGPRVRAVGSPSAPRRLNRVKSRQ